MPQFLSLLLEFQQHCCTSILYFVSAWSLSRSARYDIMPSWNILKNPSNDPWSKLLANSTGASGRSFWPIFNKRFDHLETFLTIWRPKKDLSAGLLCRPLMPSPQFKCPKRTLCVTPKLSCFSLNYVIKATEMFHVKPNQT